MAKVRTDRPGHEPVRWPWPGGVGAASAAGGGGWSGGV